MNKITTWAAISMFAVTLGLGVLAPAMATPETEDEPEHKIQICHYAEAETITNDDGTTTDVEAEWALLTIDKAGKLNGHFDKNGDTRHFENEPADGDFVIEDDEDLALCESLLPVEEEDP